LEQSVVVVVVVVARGEARRGARPPRSSSSSPSSSHSPKMDTPKLYTLLHHHLDQAHYSAALKTTAKRALLLPLTPSSHQLVRPDPAHPH